MRFHQLTPYLGLWRTNECDILEFVLNKEFMYRNYVVEYHQVSIGFNILYFTAEIGFSNMSAFCCREKKCLVFLTSNLLSQVLTTSAVKLLEIYVKITIGKF